MNILHRGHLDQDKTSQSMPSEEAGIKQASDLCHQQPPQLYKIKGLSGRDLPEDEIMSWMAAHI